MSQRYGEGGSLISPLGRFNYFFAPEQFKDGFILDLVSEDQRILKKSNEIFKKIIDWVLSVKNITKQNKINLIVNVGGATSKENLVNSFNKNIAFEKLASINELCKANLRKL